MDSERRQNLAAHFAEADPIAVTLAPTGDDHLVAVFENRARRAAGKRQRLLPVPGELEQAAARIRRRTADRARAHEIADTRIEARRGGMRGLRRPAPVEGLLVCAVGARR